MGMFNEPDLIAYADDYMGRLHSTLKAIEPQSITGMARLILKAYDDEKQIFVMGNGGSAATASHMVTDLCKGASGGLLKRFKVISLNDNLPSLLAIANDMSYEDVFVEQLKTFMKPSDLVIGISGSGNSKNVLKAIDYANAHGAITAGWTGYDGGRLKIMAQHSVHANIADMQIAEDVHLIVNHLMMKMLCKSLH